eukprot:PITA_24813
MKQAPRAWCTRIDNYFTGLGFTKSEADSNLYHIVVEGKLLIIVLYVGDLILTGDDQLIKSFKEDFAREFEMKEMVLMHYFLGMEAEKHVLRYLRGAFQYGLCYKHIEGVKLQGFTDANWAGNPSDMKSTSGGIFSIGLVIVSWYNRKQRSVPLSSAEAEYMATSQVACEAI